MIGISSFINEKILRNSKESSVLNVGVFNILTSNIWHNIKYKLGFSLGLSHPNTTLKFPLPNRWCNRD